MHTDRRSDEMPEGHDILPRKKGTQIKYESKPFVCDQKYEYKETNAQRAAYKTNQETDRTQVTVQITVGSENKRVQVWTTFQ